MLIPSPDCEPLGAEGKFYSSLYTQLLAPFWACVQQMVVEGNELSSDRQQEKHVFYHMWCKQKRISGKYRKLLAGEKKKPSYFMVSQKVSLAEIHPCAATGCEDQESLIS